MSQRTNLKYKWEVIISQVYQSSQLKTKWSETTGSHKIYDIFILFCFSVQYFALFQYDKYCVYICIYIYMFSLNIY